MLIDLKKNESVTTEMIKLKELESSFLQALPVIQKIEENGFEAYFVGGSVRDALLHKHIHDVDIATNAYPEEIKKMFHKTIDVGIDHGTVMVLFGKEMYEITTFRTESGYQDFRRPDSVTFVRSLKEDLKRRDFTINALAMDKEGQILDYFKGIEDMNEKRIQAVGNAKERFHEDALRMMRAVRFVSQLEFFLEKDTEDAVREHRALLKKIAIERIQIEFIKMLLGSGREKGLSYFIETGLYKYCPGLEGKKNEIGRFAEWKGHLTTSEQAWTVLLIFLQTPTEEVEQFLRLWKCSKKEIQCVEAVYGGLLIREDRPLSKLEIYRLGKENAQIIEQIFFQMTGDSLEEEVQEQYEDLPIHSLSDLDITGHDLLAFFDKKPGQWLGEILTCLETEVVEERVINQKSSLLEFAALYVARE